MATDPAWHGTEAATGFWQSEPFEGEPASERTEVRIGFDRNTLFVAVICFDQEPQTLQISDSRRDSELDDEDSFRLVLDTFHDRQNGFVFGTNVAGIQYDGQLTNEGRGRGRGAGGGFNLNWDTSWEVRTRRSDIGWSAEMAIPFRSLRYGTGSNTWGVNFERNVRRKTETAYWAQLDRQYNLFRVSAAGTLTGLELPRQRNLQLAPYVKGEATEGHDEETAEPVSDESVDGGIDVKYGLTPSLTLDLTVNTDFAQVEADVQQVNLDRFNLFFPEKRPFFLENAGFFTVGNPGRAELFFSRRIGLDEDGGVIPILAGARMSGRAGGFNLGLLAMRTDESGEIAANDFAVLRAGREYANRSRIGLLFTGREAVGPLAGPDDTNRTYAIDGQVGIGLFGDLRGWAAGTDTPELEGADHAFALEYSYSSPDWRWSTEYMEVGGDFNPEVGFLRRSDYRRPQLFVMRRYRPTHLGNVKEMRPRVYMEHFFTFDGFHETGRYILGNDVEWRNGFEIGLLLIHGLEGLQEPFEIVEGVEIPVGTYRNNGVRLELTTSRGRALSGRVEVEAGGFFDGDILTLRPSLNLRVGDFLSSEIAWSYNDVDLEAGSFETNLGRLRVTYAFNTTLFLQALVQYNDSSKDVSTNLRFSWLSRANTGLFVVYNEIRGFGSLALPEPDRSLVIKYSRLFDVFR